MQDVQISNIPVSAIDQADTGFRITGADDDVSALAGSMAKTGLCIPPLVCGREPEYRVVSGFRRIAAAVSLGWESIPCRVSDIGSQKELAIQAVTENAFQRELAPGELIRAIALLNRHMGAKEIAEASPDIFNMKLNTGYISSLTRICNLPRPALTLLDTGRLSVKAAKILANIGPAPAKAFIDLFATIKASSSKQVEIITWANEISAREKQSVPDLFGEQEFSDIINPEDHQQHRDKSLSGNLLRGLLFQRRFPSLDNARKRSVNQLKALKLPSGVKMVLPENFESMIYSLSFNFKSPDEFQVQLNSLDRLAGHEAFKALLKR
ncbi:MAG: ParB/RepB/Spo0J family partition protein [Desulfobacterales bacterium]|nr:ParB/RepB/Spo0J family partition protein [Desulfobacterales bacterium]